MKSKKLIFFTIVFSLIFGIVGCGSSSDNLSYMDGIITSSPESGYSSNITSSIFSEKGEIIVDQKTDEYEDTDEEINSARKLIKTVDMDIETKDFDNTINAIENKIDELNGYIEDIKTYYGSSYSDYNSNRNSNITIRIPKQKLNAFLEAIEGMSNVIRKRESVEDVTLTYVDLESHKKVLLTEQETLLDLMNQAKEISEIITIESRLSEVRYQIESMESQLRTFDNKIDYSTVYLCVEEVKELTPVIKQTAFERISNGFTESVKNIYNEIIEFGIWFIINIPYFVLWAVVIVVILILNKRTKIFKKIFRYNK